MLMLIELSASLSNSGGEPTKAQPAKIYSQSDPTGKLAFSERQLASRQDFILMMN